MHAGRKDCKAASFGLAVRTGVGKRLLKEETDDVHVSDGECCPLKLWRVPQTWAARPRPLDTHLLLIDVNVALVIDKKCRCRSGHTENRRGGVWAVLAKKGQRASAAFVIEGARRHQLNTILGGASVWLWSVKRKARMSRECERKQGGAWRWGPF